MIDYAMQYFSIYWLFFLLEVNVFQFSFADKWDIILLIIGLITAVAQGIILPWLFYLMGSLGGTFAQEVYNRCLLVSTSQCPFGIDLTVDNYGRYYE